MGPKPRHCGVQRWGTDDYRTKNVASAKSYRRKDGGTPQYPRLKAFGRRTQVSARHQGSEVPMLSWKIGCEVALPSPTSGYCIRSSVRTLRGLLYLMANAIE